MPSYSFRSDEQLAQVISYIKSSFGNKENKVTADEAGTISKSGRWQYQMDYLMTNVM
jgi:mono/diheme cytochrome c family protein